MSGALQSRSVTWRAARALTLALITSLAAACTIAESYRIDPISSGQESGVCSSALGSYSLPKAYLHIKVTQTPPAAPDIAPPPAPANPPPLANVAVEVLRHPDQSLTYCLDYLGSPLSHDAITIKKWPTSGTGGKSPFLGGVIVNANDRSVYIIEALIRAAFIVASGSSGFQPREGTTPTVTLADLEYDPFDPRESAEANARLSQLGICLIFEGHTIQSTKVGIDQYCGAPRSHSTQLNMYTKAYLKAEETPADPLLPGLMYRPRIPYRLAVYRKLDPAGPERWKLGATQIVELENFSPVLALDIRRAAFTDRVANFVFDTGTLTVACVSKASEAEGFVNIPLQISKSLVALPGAVFKVQIDQTTNQASLINAERQLYQVQQAYLQALNGQAATYQLPSGVATPTAPNYTNIPITDVSVPTDLPKEVPFGGYGKDIFAGTQSDLDKLCQGTN